MFYTFDVICIFVSENKELEGEGGKIETQCCN